jgi:hypothetical protein
MTDDPKTYEPRRKPTAQEREARRKKQAAEAEVAVRDHIEASKKRVENMKRLHALRPKAKRE